jgi:hypothetical protein
MFCYKEEPSEFIPTHGATNGVYICCELDNLLKKLGTCIDRVHCDGLSFSDEER